jgi:hypothetical protein
MRGRPGESRSLERRPGDPPRLRRDAAIALVLALLASLAVVLALAGRAGGDAGAPKVAAAGTSEAPLPPGWHRIDRPLTGVTYPRQVLAVATYPVALGHPPRGCTPTAALRQMPAGGVLLQIVEYSPRAAGHPVRVPRLPRRPRRFSYADAAYGPFECAGPSFKFVYRQDGHALQAQVWMRRRTVDPRRREEALRILDRFEPTVPASGERG